VLRSALSEASQGVNRRAFCSPFVRRPRAARGGTLNQPRAHVSHTKQSFGAEQGRNFPVHFQIPILHIENRRNSGRSISIARGHRASQPRSLPHWAELKRLLLTKSKNRPYNGGSSIQLEAACTP